MAIYGNVRKIDQLQQCIFSFVTNGFTFQFQIIVPDCLQKMNIQSDFFNLMMLFCNNYMFSITCVYSPGYLYQNPTCGRLYEIQEFCLCINSIRYFFTNLFHWLGTNDMIYVRVRTVYRNADEQIFWNIFYCWNIT